MGNTITDLTLEEGLIINGGMEERPIIDGGSEKIIVGSLVGVLATAATIAFLWGAVYLAKAWVVRGNVVAPITGKGDDQNK